MSGDSPGVEVDGVRFTDAAGREHLVHEYTAEDYGLEDIHVLFGLGRLEAESADEVVLVLNDSEVRTLKTMADAQSFDHPADFIAMCLDIHRFAAELGEGPFRLRAES